MSSTCSPRTMRNVAAYLEERVREIENMLVNSNRINPFAVEERDRLRDSASTLRQEAMKLEQGTSQSVGPVDYSFACVHGVPVGQLCMQCTGQPVISWGNGFSDDGS